jgi:hypothetical protein
MLDLAGFSCGITLDAAATDVALKTEFGLSE